MLIHVDRRFSEQIQDLGQRLMAVMSVDVRIRPARLLLDLSGRESIDELVPLSWSLTHREMAEIVGASAVTVGATE